MSRLFPAIFIGAIGCATQSSEPVEPTQTDAATAPAQADACASLVGEGWGVGDIAMNWTLQNELGDSVSLYDYCGQAIYIEDTTAW